MAEQMITVYFWVATVGVVLMIASIFIPMFDYFSDMFEPLEWLAAISFFGVFGYVLSKYTGINQVMVIVMSIIAAAGVFILTRFVVVKPMKQNESSFGLSRSDYIGVAGDILTSVTTNGVGEISVVVDYQRMNFPCQLYNRDDQPIMTGEQAIIIEFEEGIALVSKYQEDGGV